MNSLNLLSARVTRQASLKKRFGERRRSYSEGTLKDQDQDVKPRRTSSQRTRRGLETEGTAINAENSASDEPLEITATLNEKSPLLQETHHPSVRRSQTASQKLIRVLSASLKWLIHTLSAPVVLFIGIFRDEGGNFSFVMPLRRVRSLWSRKGVDFSENKTRNLSQTPLGSGIASDRGKSKLQTWRRDVDSNTTATNPSRTSTSISSDGISPKTQTSSITTSSSSDESARIRRSVRLKASHGETARKRKVKRPKSDVDVTSDPQSPPLTVDTIKSPIAPTSNVRAPAVSHLLDPPRPLIPRRQPSYSSSDSRLKKVDQKTLVIDLDETLIHSLAKGGRMSSGHMVEVKLNTTVGFGGGSIGPQHPILYYVHKRPYCDEFLRKVSKWYNLVVFTASVQEYADPVIDWLEQERKYFSARLYRQHCTFRNGAYIKDLSSVEPDLRKIMILDNSPLSYIFHEDNAIPIEGWINDPTDNDLLHLIPILEALQYTIDVRALLSLRRGESIP